MCYTCSWQMDNHASATIIWAACVFHNGSQSISMSENSLLAPKDLELIGAGLFPSMQLNTDLLSIRFLLNLMSSKLLFCKSTELSHRCQENESTICFCLTHTCTLFEAFYPDDWTHTVQIQIQCTTHCEISSCYTLSITYIGCDYVMSHSSFTFGVNRQITSRWKLVSSNCAALEGHLNRQAHYWQCQTRA